MRERSFSAPWWLVISGQCSPWLNMGLDLVFWQNVRTGKSPPVLRFYSWQPPSVSLGYKQKAERLINVEFCHCYRIPVVQRPTGGSALFHDLELTYSFTARKDDYPAFSGPVSSYLTICHALQRGLKKLGLSVEVRGFSDTVEPSFARQSCFNLSSRHDLVILGRKLVGSAQRRDKESFLQHGSLLLGLRKNLWEKIFLEPVNFEKVATVADFLSPCPEEKKIISCLLAGFQEIFHRKFSLTEPAKEEIQQAWHLAQTHCQPLI